MCIPTTAGTGSEIGRSSVITLAGTQRRSVIFLPRLLAKLVILDPEVTVDLPPILTAATGLDALTHCIEAYANKFAHPIVDQYALQGIRLISQNLLRAVQNGADVEARAALARAAAGVAEEQEPGGVTAVVPAEPAARAQRQVGPVA